MMNRLEPLFGGEGSSVSLQVGFQYPAVVSNAVELEWHLKYIIESYQFRCHFTEPKKG